VMRGVWWGVTRDLRTRRVVPPRLRGLKIAL
jgi:hypothetical protein